MSRTLIATAAIASLLLAASADAKTFVVSKGGQFPTIQSAVNVSSSGDTIEVKPGTYRENVVVNPNRPGLTIDGSGKVIIDAFPANGSAAGPGIVVLASDVTLRDLTVTNARKAGFIGAGVYVTAARVTLEDLKVSNCEDAGLYVTSNTAEIRDCQVRACRYGITAKGGGITVKDFEAERVFDGIRIVGNGARVTECQVVRAYSRGFDIEGNDARIKDCYVTGASSVALEIAGDDARVTDCRAEDTHACVRLIGHRAIIKKNKIRRQHNVAIKLSGDDHKVLDNSIDDSATAAIEIKGEGATVSGNKIRRTLGSAVYVRGGGFVIADNSLRESTGGYGGIYVRDAIGGLIADNEIRDTSGSGVAIKSSCQSLEIRDNEVTSCGLFGYEAFDIDGDGHLVVDNVASKCSVDGFLVRGKEHVLKGNEARDCGTDGFDLGGSNHQLRDNLAEGNGAEGIDVSSSNTLVKNNECEKNRIDLANDGLNNVFEGNDFKSGGPTVAGQLD